MKLLHLFVAGALLAQPAFTHVKEKKAASIWIDFDGTVATNEAFETLALAAYDSMDAEQTAELPPWSYYGEVYYKEYNDADAAYGPRDNISAEIVYRASPALRKVEADSFDRVASAGVFKYTKLSVLQQAAAAVTIRDGFWKFVVTAHAYDITPQIVSLNWSVNWIRLVLRENLKQRLKTATKAEKQWLNEGLSENIAIYCSEILPEGVVKAGELDFPTRLHSGMDKVELMREIESKKKDSSDRVVFYGDSGSDLPPLMLEPTTIGIVTGSGVDKLGTKFGFELEDLDLDKKRVQETAGDNFLYKVDQFALSPSLAFPDGKYGKKKDY